MKTITSVTFGALLVAIGLGACGDVMARESSGGSLGEKTEQLGVDFAEHPIDDVLLDTEKYIGQQVSVSSDVEAILGAHAFTLAAPEGPFLVLSRTQHDDDLINRGTAVEVTGAVREAFSVSAFEQEFNVDIDDALLNGFEDETYVVADNVSEPSNVESG